MIETKQTRQEILIRGKEDIHALQNQGRALATELGWTSLNQARLLSVIAVLGHAGLSRAPESLATIRREPGPDGRIKVEVLARCAEGSGGSRAAEEDLTSGALGNHVGILWQWVDEVRIEREAEGLRMSARLSQPRRES